MRKNFAALLIACLIGTSVFAGGRTGLGIRISSWNDQTIFGVTLNHHFKRGAALEGIVDFPSSGVIISGLYERFYGLNRSGNFCFLYGGGIFIATGGGTSAGLRGVLGLDYRFQDIPINIGIDWMPALQFTPEVDGIFKNLGLSVRYTF
jgi:hypothetical protein